MGKHAGKVVDAQVAAANDIYSVAQENANQKLQALKVEMEETVDAVRQEAFAQGAVRALDSTIAYNEMLKYVTLQNIKQHKEYKKGGLTWDGFCESIGLDRRNVDRVLGDVGPLVKDFSDKMSVFCGIPFNKIRCLGRSISDNLSEIRDGALVYNGESIPLSPENAEDLQAILDKIEADKEEAETKARIKDREIESKNDVIRRQEKALLKYSKKASERNLTPGEDAFLQRMENLQIGFDGYMLKADPDAATAALDPGEELTIRMRASLISTLSYMKMQILAAYDNAVLNYGDPSMNPELLEEMAKFQAQVFSDVKQ